MLAFQAPPDAVIAPVTQAAKIAGMMSCRQRCQPRMPMFAAISRRSLGTLCAPLIMVYRALHCWRKYASRSCAALFISSP
jgi:hypothetical protein